MAEYVNVALDAMGGDNAPGEIVKGAVEAVNEDKRVKVFLVGKEPLIREELKSIHIRLNRLRLSMQRKSLIWLSLPLWQSERKRIPQL